jgi:hypothetical protein
MPKENININLSEEELSSVISALLFSSSVNIVSNTDASYQRSLLDIAVKLKTQFPKIKLPHIQFLQEQDYEDEWSEEIFNEFKNNIEIVSFEGI